MSLYSQAIDKLEGFLNEHESVDIQVACENAATIDRLTTEAREANEDAERYRTAFDAEKRAHAVTQATFDEYRRRNPLP